MTTAVTVATLDLAPLRAQAVARTRRIEAAVRELRAAVAAVGGDVEIALDLPVRAPQ